MESEMPQFRKKGVSGGYHPINNKQPVMGLFYVYFGT